MWYMAKIGVSCMLRVSMNVVSVVLGLMGGNEKKRASCARLLPVGEVFDQWIPFDKRVR